MPTASKPVTNVDIDPLRRALLMPRVQGPIALEITTRVDSFLDSADKEMPFVVIHQDDDNQLWLGPCPDSIDEAANSTDLCWDLWQGGILYETRAEQAIILGLTQQWKVAIDAGRNMTIRNADSDEVLAYTQLEQLPNLRMADNSHFEPRLGSSDLHGAILSFGWTMQDEQGETIVHQQRRLVSHDRNMRGAFTMEALVRFDHVGQGRTWQRIMDFGDPSYQYNVMLSQCRNTADLCFWLWKDGLGHRLRAYDVLEEGVLTHWKAGVDPDGLMWLEKDGERVAEKMGIVPVDRHRKYRLIGSPNKAKDDSLEGVILGLHVENL